MVLRFRSVKISQVYVHFCQYFFSIADYSAHETFRTHVHVPLEDIAKNALEQYHMPALSARSNHCQSYWVKMLDVS